jgi:hypothetical protein
MITSKKRLWPVLGAVAGFATGCAHTEMSADEHRAVAARLQQRADEERAAFDQNATAVAVGPRSPFADEPPAMRQYNPTAVHLAEADRQNAEAFEHLKAAQKLEKYEDQACSGITAAERTACPLLAPYISAVEELSSGISLHLKPGAPAATLANQMQCHLAFAKANGFDRAPCPLFVKGVKIKFHDNRQIDVVSADATVAGEVRLEARKLFGEPLAIK